MCSIGSGSLLNDKANLINHTQTRGAARKGKRIQRAMENRKNAMQKRILAAQKQNQERAKNIKVDKNVMKFMSERERDLTLPPPPEDDIYFTEKFRRKKVSIEEAIEMHKQFCHPDVYNMPDALVIATVELNLKMKIKRKRYIEKIETTVCLPNLYEASVRQRKIVALTKNEEDQEKAREAGAIMAGAMDIATLMKANKITYRDFDHLVCHSEFLPEFAAVKGMKAQPFFPTVQRGNFGDDIVKLVTYFKNGQDYSLKKVPESPNYGFIDCSFGRIQMSTEHLKENLLALLQSIDRFRPLNLADDKQFIERVSISVPDASKEIFYIRFWEFMTDYKDPETIGIEVETADQKLEAVR